jgi:hypothetical protein
MANRTSIPGSREVRGDAPLAQGGRRPSVPLHGGDVDPMPPKRREPPSRARYAARHPAHSIRFDPETEAKIVAIRERTGCSFNQAVCTAVSGLDDAAIEVIHAKALQQGFERGVNTARAPAHAAGFAAGAHLYRLTVPCANCHEPIEILNDDSSADSVRRVLIEAGIAHTTCPSQRD